MSQTTVTTAETPEVAEAINKVRPLNATQAKALRTLVQQDFDVVERDMHSLYEAEVSAVTARIEAEWKDKGANAPAFEQQAHDLIKSFEDALRALMADASSKGVRLETHLGRDGYGRSNIRQYVSAEVEGKDKAIREAVDEVRRNYNRAVNELRRSQTGVERRILVAQVTGDAEGLLQSLPSAQTLMLSSAAAEAVDVGRDRIISA